VKKPNQGVRITRNAITMTRAVKKTAMNAGRSRTARQRVKVTSSPAASPTSPKSMSSAPSDPV
jgi:hypothetical protein